MTPPPKKRLFRLGLLVGLVGLALVLARPTVHLLVAVATDVDEIEALPEGWMDDASRQSRTRVAEVWDVPIDDADPEGQISRLLARARTEGRCVSIAGARHSMGGHTFYPGGIVLNMLPWSGMSLDEERDLLTVQSGALWKDVIAYLDQRGRSVQVMQSDNSFSVGGSISVNCHGWQFGRPPIASTVESFRLMQANGTVVRCSRAENSELFSLVLGGYGLFGVILDVELWVTSNRRYRVEQYVVPVVDALATFDALVVDEPGVEMLYARMNVAPDSFLEEIVLSVFVEDPDGEIPELTEPSLVWLRRAVFRGSQKSDYGKRLRWTAETKLQPLLAGTISSRNQLLNDSVEDIANRSSETTDILHEYFVPRHRSESFVRAVRGIVPEHGADLLNVTVRSVNEDEDTFLRYADQPMIAFVMLFTQERNAAGEAKMQALTRDLVDVALEHEGRHYLPYRLHATSKQFLAAYPRAPEFFELKRTYDPDELFQNHFYIEYGSPSVLPRPSPAVEEE